MNLEQELEKKLDNEIQKMNEKRDKNVRNVYAKEENVKNQLACPVLGAMEWDVTEPEHFSFEFPDLGFKSESADGAFFGKNDEPLMVLETKKVSEDINKHISQLGRYFVSKESIKFGILTNMVDMHFFADFDLVNVMDEKPFYSIHFPSIKPEDIEFLLMFRRGHFIDHHKEVYEKCKQMKLISKEQILNELPSEFFNKVGMSREQFANWIEVKNPAFPTKEENGLLVETTNEDIQEDGRRTRTVEAFPIIKLFGEEMRCHTAKAFYLKFLEKMIAKNPSEMANIQDWFPTKRAVRFHRDRLQFTEGNFRTYCSKLSNGVFVTTALNKEKIIENCLMILDCLGYSSSDLQILPNE